MVPLRKEMKQLRQELFKQLSPEMIEEMAKQTRLIQRKRKLTPSDTLFLFVFTGKHLSKATLNDLCGVFHQLTGITLTSEGLNQRFNEQAVSFLRKVFESLLHATLGKTLASVTKYAALFKQILVLDSTAFHLPDTFSESFPGTGCTSVKFQIEFDLLNGQFSHAHFEAGRTSDVVTGDQLSQRVQEETLILRDLGYLNLNELNELNQQEARYFISRLKRNAIVYRKNPAPRYHKNGTIQKKTEYIRYEIGEIAETVKEGESQAFEEIYVGTEKMKIRLIIYHFTKEEREKRLQKVTNGARGKRHDCSERTKQMTAYNFYITNLPNEVETAAIHELYSLRWQIELLFKSWKSTIDLAQCKPMKIERLYCYFYSQLIQMMLCTMVTYQMRYFLWEKSQKELSEMKGFKLVFDRLKAIYEAILKGTDAVVQELLLLYDQLEVNGLKSRKRGKPTFQQLIGTL